MTCSDGSALVLSVPPAAAGGRQAGMVKTGGRG
jgi:hypothetical protein